jgi:hypothetical protein
MNVPELGHSCSVPMWYLLMIHSRVKGMPRIVEMGQGRHLKRKTCRGGKVAIDLRNFLPVFVLAVALVVL